MSKKLWCSPEQGCQGLMVLPVLTGIAMYFQSNRSKKDVGCSFYSAPLYLLETRSLYWDKYSLQTATDQVVLQEAVNHGTPHSRMLTVLASGLANHYTRSSSHLVMMIMIVSQHISHDLIASWQRGALFPLWVWDNGGAWVCDTVHPVYLVASWVDAISKDHIRWTECGCKENQAHRNYTQQYQTKQNHTHTHRHTHTHTHKNQKEVKPKTGTSQDRSRRVLASTLSCSLAWSYQSIHFSLLN